MKTVWLLMELTEGTANGPSEVKGVYDTYDLAAAGAAELELEDWIVDDWDVQE